MAFVQYKLDKSVQQTRGIFDKYIYSPDNGDTISDVTASNYFLNSRFIGVNWIGSLLECNMADGYVLLQIESNATVSVKYDSRVAQGLSQRVVVTSASDLSGVLDSTKEYFLDGVIDMGSQSIEVPPGGLTLSGYNFDISKLVSTAPGYTMFSSSELGSGNILGKNYAIEVTGIGSQVYDLKSSTGFEAFEFNRINYNNCSSLGVIDNYRQGFESGTGRFGGTPDLTLEGLWLGGYFINASIVRDLVNGPYSLFQAGPSFIMGSRFRTNQNVDLSSSASFVDFSSLNFPNPSTLQITDAIVTRNGLSNAEDPNITPNIAENELASAWINNQGMKNTFVGGKLDVSSEVTTIINTQGVFEVLGGLFTPSDLQHFDSPVNGQLRHLGDNPRDFLVYIDATVDGPSNNQIALRVVKFDFSLGTTVVIDTQNRQINNLLGIRDVAFFNVVTNIELDQNDYLFLEITNNSGTGNLTAELETSLLVTER